MNTAIAPSPVPSTRKPSVLLPSISPELETHQMLHVSLYDIDFAQIVNNIVYLRWLEDLRLALMQRIEPFEAVMQRGLLPTIVRTEIEYKHPIRLADKVEGRMWIGRAGERSLTWQAQIFVNGEIAAEATQIGVLMSAASGKAVRPPADWLARFPELAVNQPVGG